MSDTFGQGGGSAWGDPQPGWYVDPMDPSGARMRYWNGSTWTEHVIPGADGRAGRLPRRTGRWILLAGIVMVLLAALAAVLINLRSAAGPVAGDSSAPPTTLAPPTPGSATPTASADEPSSAPTSTPVSPDPSSASLSKRASAALNRFQQAYDDFWNADSLDENLSYADQLRPRADELQVRLQRMETAFGGDAWASSPDSGFPRMLAASRAVTSRIVKVISEMEACETGLIELDLACEIDVFAASESSLRKLDRRLSEALNGLSVPDEENPASRSVEFDVGVGECFTQGQPYQTVPCSNPHDGEVYATYVVPASLIAPYPGEEKITSIAERQCPRKFEAYVGVELDLSELSVAFVYPSPESWTAGARLISCIAQLEGERLEGSVQGSQR